MLEVNQLKKYFPIKEGLLQRTVGYVRAVDGISFNIKRGTTMGLVGESGCGKTTVGRTILRLTDKSGGEVLFNGREVHELSRNELRALRPKMQIIPIPACRPACPSAKSWAKRFVSTALCPRTSSTTTSTRS